MQQNELPEGWEEAPLEQLLMLLESGSRPKGGVRGISEGIPSIGGEHLNDNGGFRFEKVKFVSEEFFEKMNQGLIQLNDILIVKDGATTGKVSIVRRDFPYARAAVNEHVFLCRSYSLIDPYYVFYFLFSEIGQQRILNNFRGSAQGGINKSFAPNTLIPLPPLPEQHRIVTSIEALFSRLDATNERLDRVQGIMKTFRQAVLAAACDGRLTEDWRKQEAELKDDWRWVKVDSILRDSKKGMKTGPFGTALKKDEHQASGVPVYGIENIGEGVFRMPNKIFITEEKARELEAFKVQPNDIVISRSGTVGEICAIPEKMKEGIISTNLMRIRLNRSLISTKYFVYLFQGGNVREQVKGLCKGSTRAFLNQTILSSINFPLPPLPEQQEIVRRVDALFAFADSIEAKVAVAREKTEKLRQSILAKAFSGELVPTEAELARQEGRSYESAEMLLKRIKAEGKGSKK